MSRLKPDPDARVRAWARQHQNAPRHACSLHACAIPFVRAALANGEMEDPVIYWWSKTAELDARLTGIALAELDVRLVSVTTQTWVTPRRLGTTTHPLDA